LLEAALVALSAEPPAYDTTGRGGHLASLILDEITRAPTTPFALPVPADRRLRQLAQRLIEHPGSPLDIDHWANEVGVSRRTLTRVFRAQTGLSFGALASPSAPVTGSRPLRRRRAARPCRRQSRLQQPRRFPVHGAPRTWHRFCPRLQSWAGAETLKDAAGRYKVFSK
jgi:AraC-like DNA-binding protein